MGQRVRLVFGIVALVLMLPLAAAAQTVHVTDPNSVYYKNIETAIKFLREHGETQAANEIADRLKNGWIYVKPLKANGETTISTGTMYISTDVATNTRTQKLRETPFDPNNPADFGNIVALARTLYHENFHSHEQDGWDAIELGEEEIEHQAWNETINAMERWLWDEKRKYFTPSWGPRPGLSPADYLRELKHIQVKIGIIDGYIGSLSGENEYFGFVDDKQWLDSINNYWKNELGTYVLPEIKKLNPPPVEPTDPDAPVTGGGGGTPTTPTTPDPPKTDPAPAPDPPPAPGPPPAPPCEPCRKIADQIQDVKQRLKTLADNVKKANDAVTANQRQVANLQKRVANLQAELARGAGTGGSSYDPATGRTVNAWDQGNGTVKVTTRDAAGNVIDEYTRDSSARKADINRQITETNAEIEKAQAEGKRLETAAATAKKLLNDMATLLEQLVAELEECIKKYCSNLSTSDALNMLQLPYANLDVLKDPTTYNAFDGSTSDAFQTMIIEIRVGNAPGMTVPRGSPVPSRGALDDFRQPRSMLAALLSWLRPNPGAWMTINGRWSRDERRPWSMEIAEQNRNQAASRSPVQMLLTSLGQSTGQAFDLQVFNGTGRSFKLAAQSLVVEPLKDEVKRQVQNGMQQLIRSTSNPITAKINGYCLEFLKAPPTAGTLFKIAAPELQQRFAPMRQIMDASRRVQQLGQLRPDSNPDGYFHSIRQWAMWTVEQKLNEKTFANSFVEHTKKAVTAQKQPWSNDTENIIRKAAPNRWNDIQKVLSAAGVAVPR
ncbi:MAG: hypothetical protein K2Y23_27320 [Cyanobacteria bacterium]|nr:hypothetical protein [Cyanobacteriota bacterium]